MKIDLCYLSRQTKFSEPDQFVHELKQAELNQKKKFRSEAVLMKSSCAQTNLTQLG